MAAVEQTYAYLAPSTVDVDSDGTEVTLSTSGGGSPHPYFFTGLLGAPPQTAPALLARRGAVLLLRGLPRRAAAGGASALGRRRGCTPPLLRAAGRSLATRCGRPR